MYDFPPVKECTDHTLDTLFERMSKSTEPLVLKGLVSDWPLVQSSRESNESARSYLLRYYKGAPLTTFLSKNDIKGRIFYTDDLTETNFNQVKLPLTEIFEQLTRLEDVENPQTVYMGSAAVNLYLPGFREQNGLPNMADTTTVRIWIGNRTTVAAHYDAMDNVACVCAGRRRFTLFPPDQLENLYIGPIDFTPGGQQVSLVDLDAPDLERFPRYSEAMKHAQTVVLEPGDAIFIPSMWWHHVESLDDLNILVNYWWRKSPAYMGPPVDVLLHALLSLRDLPPEQKAAWAGIFEHYIFGQDAPLEHIPEASRGVLGPMDETGARQLRATLLARLNR